MSRLPCHRAHVTAPMSHCEGTMRAKKFAMKFVWPGFCGLALAVACAGGANAEPVTIRNSWVAPVTNWASILLEKKDLAKHFGQSYVMEPVHYGGTPPMITALANNELEISNLAYSTLGIAVENAGLTDLSVV